MTADERDIPAGTTAGGPGQADANAFSAPRRAPLYQQTYALITRGLQHGEWQPGDMIPSEQQLAGRFSVSAGTVRKAIDRLVAEHLLVRRQGKGTFVASHLEQRSRFRFLRMRDRKDRIPEFQSRVLTCRKTRAKAEVAQFLGLAAGAGLVHVRRLLEFDGTPTVLDDLWLPASHFRDLSLDQLKQWRGPLYGLFESAFGVQMIEACERVRAVRADATVAGLLAVSRGSPVLRVDRVTETFDGEKVEFRRGYYLTDDYHYLSRLA